MKQRAIQKRHHLFSPWNVDGTVKSRLHLIFNGIALGCFISGDTYEIIEL